MKSIFFTADTHFNHANIIHFCGRPFTDITEMNAALIEKWNAKVGKSDLVYHLGDLAWGDWEPVLGLLHGEIILMISTPLWSYRFLDSLMGSLAWR